MAATEPTRDVYDPPEGYLSQAGWSRHVALATVFTLLLLVAQLVVPQLLAFWLFGNAVFQSSVVVPHAAAAVSDGERIWIPVTRAGGAAAGVISLRAYNFEGQLLKETPEILLSGVPLRILADGPRLWLLNGSSVVRIEEGRIAVKHYPRRGLNRPTQPFLHEGQLAVLDPDLQGEWEFLRFQDGEWVNGGYLVPPEGATATRSAANRGRASANRAVMAGAVAVTMTGESVLSVASSGNDFVILWRELSSQPVIHVSCYTTSLPLAKSSTRTSTDDEDSPVSAVIPLNTIHAAEQALWKTTTATSNSLYFHVLGFVDHQPVLIALEYTTNAVNNQQVVARSLETGGAPLAAMNALTFNEFAVVEHEGQMLIVNSGYGRSDVSVRPLRQEVFAALPRLTIAGSLRDVPGKVWAFYGTYLGVLALLLTLMLTGFQVLMNWHRTSTYAFGAYTVRHGSYGRRVVARWLDTVLFCVPVIAFVAWVSLTVDLRWFAEQFSGDWTLMIQLALGTLLGLMIYALTGIILWGFFEGLCGWSPGKLLCGLRVIRTTFEPLGLFRGIVRQICLIADGFFMGLVGSLLIAVTARQQRLGDWVADSIVVDARSLAEQRRAVTVDALQ